MTAPVWTPPPLVSTGDVETAAQFDALLGTGGDLDFLHVAKALRVRASAAQSIPDTTVTLVTWNTEDFDLFAAHSTSANTSRITIPSTLPGVWKVHAQAQFAANATGQRNIELWKNGVLAVGPSSQYAPPAGVCTVDITSLFNLVAGDYIEVKVSQTTGGALNLLSGSVASFFEAVWLGSAT